MNVHVHVERAGWAARRQVHASFVLMDLQGQNVVTYVYEMVDGDVKVKKIEHTKGAPQKAEE